MPHGIHRGHKDGIYLSVNQPGHMAKNQLDRIAGFLFDQLLAAANNIFIGLRREQNIIAQGFEKIIGHRKHLIHHQGAGDADGLPARPEKRRLFSVIFSLSADGGVAFVCCRASSLVIRAIPKAPVTEK